MRKIIFSILIFLFLLLVKCEAQEIIIEVKLFDIVVQPGNNITLNITFYNASSPSQLISTNFTIQVIERNFTENWKQNEAEREIFKEYFNASQSSYFLYNITTNIISTFKVIINATNETGETINSTEITVYSGFHIWQNEDSNPISCLFNEKNKNPWRDIIKIKFNSSLTFNCSAYAGATKDLPVIINQVNFTIDSTLYSVNLQDNKVYFVLSNSNFTELKNYDFSINVSNSTYGTINFTFKIFVYNLTYQVVGNFASNTSLPVTFTIYANRTNSTANETANIKVTYASDNSLKCADNQCNFSKSSAGNYEVLIEFEDKFNINQSVKLNFKIEDLTIRIESDFLDTMIAGTEQTVKLSSIKVPDNIAVNSDWKIEAQNCSVFPNSKSSANQTTIKITAPNEPKICLIRIYAISNQGNYFIDAEKTLEIEVIGKREEIKGSLKITEYQNEIIIERGKSFVFNITVYSENLTQNVSIFIFNLPFNINYNPKFQIIEANKSKNFTIQISIPSNAEIKKYEAKIFVNSSCCNDTKFFNLTVVRSAEEIKLEELKNNLENFKNFVNQSKNLNLTLELKNLLDGIEQKINELNKSIEQKNITQAEKLRDEIQQLINLFQTKLQEKQKEEKIEEKKEVPKQTFNIFIIAGLVAACISAILIFVFRNQIKSLFAKKSYYKPEEKKFVWKPSEEQKKYYEEIWEKLKEKWKKETKK